MAEVRYECNRGYELVGQSVMTCQESGAWSAPMPFCRLRENIFLVLLRKYNCNVAFSASRSVHMKVESNFVSYMWRTDIQALLRDGFTKDDV